MVSLFSENSEYPRLLVGTYTQPQESTSEGIYVYCMHPGHEPRILALELGGRFLVAAHQKSRNVLVYRIRPPAGDLSHTAHEAQLDLRVDVLFV